MLARFVGADVLARPGTMAPWKEDDEELGEDIAVRDIEVVFQGGDIDIAVELFQRMNASAGG